jgi:hypothetical protein
LRASAKGTGGSTGSLSLHDSAKLNYRSRFDVNRIRDTTLMILADVPPAVL